MARASQELFRLRSRNPASALALLRAAEAGPSLRERVAAREQQVEHLSCWGAQAICKTVLNGGKAPKDVATLEHLWTSNTHAG